MEGTIHISFDPEREELRRIFLRSGFANESRIKAELRLRPCATGTFVNSSYSNPTCEKCPAGKIHFSVTKLREKST